MTTQALLNQKAEIPINGCSFYRDAVKTIHEGMQIRVIPEPDNPHDPNALAVVTMQGQKLGHIPAKLAYRIVKETEKPTAFIGKISDVHLYWGEPSGADIVLTAVIPEGSRLAHLA